MGVWRRSPEESGDFGGSSLLSLLGVGAIGRKYLVKCKCYVSENIFSPQCTAEMSSTVKGKHE